MSKSKSKVAQHVEMAVAGIDSAAADGPRDKEQQDEDDGEAVGGDAEYETKVKAQEAADAEYETKVKAYEAARERFERTNALFLTGGCTRDEVEAARHAMDA